MTWNIFVMSIVFWVVVFKTKTLLACSSTFWPRADGNESTSVKEYIFQNIRMFITALFLVAKYMGL